MLRLITAMAAILVCTVVWTQDGEGRSAKGVLSPGTPIEPGIAVEDVGCGTWVEQGNTEQLRLNTGRLNWVHAVDENVVWATGGDGDLCDGDVLRTVDGGATWETVTPENFCASLSLFGFDGSTCLVGQNSGKIMRTTDGGQTWTLVQDVGSFLNGIHFFDEQHGWAYADPFWRVQVTIETGPHAGESFLGAEGRFTTPIESLPGQAMGGPTIYVGNACPGDMVPPAPGPGFIALVPGQIGGVVCRFDEKATNVIDAGYEGMVVFRREDGGDALLTMTGDPRDIPGVFVGHSTGLRIAGVASAGELVVGEPGAEITATTYAGGHSFNLWTTSDQGVTWTPSPTAPACSTYLFGQAWSWEWVGTEVGIIGSGNTSGLPSPVYRTSDGGQTWDEIPTGLEAHLGISVNDSTGFGLLAGAYDGPPMFTTDFGLTWEPVQGLPPSFISYGPLCIDGDIRQGFVSLINPGVPVTDLFRTRDGGQSWDECGFLNVYVNHLSFLDPFRNYPAIDYTGWAVGMNTAQTEGHIWKIEEVIGIAPVLVPAPVRLELRSHPNPFNPLVILDFEIPAAGQARLQVYDSSGRLVRIVGDARLDPGAYSFTWDGRDDGGSPVASGVYLVELRSGAAAATSKLVLVK